jgi:serine/threonine protein kinase
MSWPLSQDYNEAIQSPARNFTDADLQRGTAVANALGLPMPYSGNFADVYQMQCPDGSRWAVKCFTRETPDLRERYAEISRHLRQTKLPFTVDFNYLEQGIRVAGKWFPALKMQWVEGLSLNQFVARAADKPATLEALLQVWARMAGYLRAAEVAHCDLQHGNVLLVPGAGASSLALKLVDYDGTWVPALAGHQSGEVGHPSYQHPARAREGTYGPEVDRFSLLLVATALRALMTGGRALWEKYDNGDNLLFTEADLQAPAKSRLFLDLIRSADPLASSLAKQLIDALRAGVESAPLLEELLPESRPAASAVSPRVTRPAAPEPADVPVAPVAVETERKPTRSVGAAPLIHPPGRTKARRQRVPVAVWVGVVAGIVVIAGAVGTIFFLLREGQVHRDLPGGPTSPSQRIGSERYGASRCRGAATVSFLTSEPSSDRVDEEGGVSSRVRM